MKPEAAEHLDRAGEYLIKARNQLDVLHYNDEAVRAAYLAALHGGYRVNLAAPSPFPAEISCRTKSR